VSRVLLTWELGLNLGHLTRLLPVAQQLKAEGHTVLVATRDIQAASTVLSPAGIPYVQAPHLPKGIALAHRASGYADILLSQGWSDRPTLHGLTHAWLNLFRLFNPERLLLDYSPTVSLAARIAKIPTVLMGNGFELPPATDPLPAFPGFSWATPAKSAESEGIAVANANVVLGSYRGQPITALRDLVLGQVRLLATFPELDHYGERLDARYVGPLLGDLKAPRIPWPRVAGPKIFACLRPDTSHVQLILSALAGTNARVVCVASGFTSAQLEGFRKDHIHFSSTPVDLESLSDADLCITYGAEGTMLKFLLAGVPQLVSPWHVETFMAARRVEALHAGCVLKEAPTAECLASYLAQLCCDPELEEQAAAFSRRHADCDSEKAVAAITCAINTPQEKTACRNSNSTVEAPNGREKIVARSGSLPWT
jgi:UDP:flavonoid glycosyltransferase YjiC (YdhE family)